MISRREMIKNAAATAATVAAAGSVAACTQAGRGGERPAAILPEPRGPLVPEASIVMRPAEARGGANHGWLDTKHTFSFADYHDPRHMGFRSLRVINEDRVAPGQGFPMHPHRDMEIVTYVLEGALEHKDTLGNGGVIRPGEVQRMSAGTGIRHSEYNPSKGEGVHLLQVWIEPDLRGATPSYDQKTYSTEDRSNRMRLVASGEGHDGSIKINTATNLFATILEPGRTVVQEVPTGRYAWVHVARGNLTLNGKAMKAGDGAAVTAAGLLELKASNARPAELLLFDLA